MEDKFFNNVIAEHVAATSRPMDSLGTYDLPKNGVVDRAAKYVAKMPESISGQGGHDKLLAAARVLVHDFALPDSEVRRILDDFNRRCTPPWSEREIEHKISEAKKLSNSGRCDGAKGNLRNGKFARFVPRPTTSTNTHNARNARALTDWSPPIQFHDFENLPPFPVDALPGWAREIVTATATATQTPPDLAGGLLLSILALCGAGKLRVKIRSGWSEPLNIFCVSALASGNRKTAVFNILTSPLTGWERREAKRLAPEIAKAKAEREVIEHQLRDAKSRAAKSNDADRIKALDDVKRLAVTLDSTVMPMSPRLFCDDATPEVLAKLLCEHGGRMAMLSDEGDLFEIFAGRYSESANFGVLLHGHAGSPLRVDRIGRPPDHVDSPALTIGLCVQPDVIESLGTKPGFRGRGLLARFLYALPVSLLGRRQIEPPSVPLQILKEYEVHIWQLLAIPWTVANTGTCMSLTSEARDVHRDFQAELEPKLAPGGELDTLTDFAGKLAGTVARIAGCLHLAGSKSEQWVTPIAGSTMEAAIALGRYYVKHAEAAFSLMGADPNVKFAKRILAWIKRKACAEFTRRELTQDLRTKTADTTEPLSLLMEHDYIRARAEQRSGLGRKPEVGPHAFDVNPKIL